MSDTNLFRYHGSHNAYVDIASRGDERLGISLFYFPINGSVIVRFVAHSPKGSLGSFAHFLPRDKAEFLPVEKKSLHLTAIEGVRLNKFEVKVFNQPVSPVHLETLGDALSTTGVGASLWLQLAEWITDQAQKDGFVVTVNLPIVIKEELVPSVPEGTVMAPQFPDLGLYRAKKLALKAASKPSVPQYADDDEDDEDQETIN